MTVFPPLVIPQTLAAGPGPGATDPRVIEAFANAGVADHMQADVLRGMVEAKIMLREVFGTKNVHTFGVAGTGFSGLDCAMSAILPGDAVVAFVNGTFSGIDGLTIRLKAATREELAADPLNPRPANVTIIEVPHGQSVTGEIVEAALAKHKPLWAFMAHSETGSGRVNDIAGFNAACARHGAMGIVDAVSSLGVEYFNIDDYPAIVAWASCPQKGVLCIPLTYAPVSFRQEYIDLVLKRGAPTYIHHPVLAARHWGIAGGKDVESAGYHRTHSSHAVAAFHEALRMLLERGRKQKAADYAFHEAALRAALEQMGCRPTSNMTSLIVFDLPPALAGKEREIVNAARAEGFGIWTTLSEPLQLRIGILNMLNAAAITEIAERFADSLLRHGADFDKQTVLAGLKARLAAG